MIDRIYLLESIPFNQRQTGKELYNDTISRYCEFYKSEITYSYTSIDSQQQLFNKLIEIGNEVSSDNEIILHIEAHGLDDKTSIVLSNNDLIAWKELEDYLITINLKTKNKLHLNLLTCFGMYVAEKINLSKTAPYKSFTAANKSLLPDEIIYHNTLLYEEIIKQQEMYKAYEIFSRSNPTTKIHIKDVEMVLEIVMRLQIERFLTQPIPFDIITFYNVTYNISINTSEFNSITSIEGKSDYIFRIFSDKYFPK